jgi:hypothetical protein
MLGILDAAPCVRHVVLHECHAWLWLDTGLQVHTRTTAAHITADVNAAYLYVMTP